MKVSLHVDEVDLLGVVTGRVKPSTVVGTMRVAFEESDYRNEDDVVYFDVRVGIDRDSNEVLRTQDKKKLKCFLRRQRRPRPEMKEDYGNGGDDE